MTSVYEIRVLLGTQAGEAVIATVTGEEAAKDRFKKAVDAWESCIAAVFNAKGTVPIGIVDFETCKIRCDMIVGIDMRLSELVCPPTSTTVPLDSFFTCDDFQTATVTVVNSKKEEKK